jgi:predicted nuclease of predicted toxin-antitoxin system
MRLILDQGVPRDAAGFLREGGYDCIHVGEIGMWAAADSEILAWAAGREAIIVTLDADFHAILKWVLANYEADLARGCVVTVKPRKITSHRLPIGRGSD